MTDRNLELSSSDYDFGFSLLSEDELKEVELQLRTEVKSKETEKNDLESAYRKRMTEIRNMIRPLLVNLSKNPEKTHIYWPQRSKIVGDVLKRFDKLFDMSVNVTS